MSEIEPTEGGRKRASRFVRASNPPRFVLTPRDWEVLRTVGWYRLLSQSQIQLLHFKSRNIAQVRLQHLWQHQFLRRLYTNGFVTNEALYTLDKRGIELLQTDSTFDSKHARVYRSKVLNPLLLAHTLALTSIHISAELSARRNSFEIVTWLDDVDSKNDYDRVYIDNQWIPVVPDGYFCIKAGEENYHFLLEYDHGTEGLRTIERKFRAYQLFLQNGMAERRYDTSVIRILFVMQSKQKRLLNVRNIAASLDLEHHFWITDKESLDKDCLTEAIWYCGRNEDRQALISGTDQLQN